MRVVLDDLMAPLGVCANLLEWSERAGLPGDRGRLWRKHAALQRHIDSSGSGTGAAVDRLLHLEVEAWTDVTVASLRADIVDRLVTTLAPRVGSLWAGLDRERRSQIAQSEMFHQRSSISTLSQSLLRFRVSPSLSRIAEALGALEDLVELNCPRRSPFSTEESKAGIDRLVALLDRELPAVAADFLGSLVEARFTSKVDSRWLAEAPSTPGRRAKPMWAPSWQQLRVPTYAPVEPLAIWFLPEVQQVYEEVRLARELDQAHAHALAEDQRRANEIAEAERRAEQLAGLERDLDVRLRELEAWDKDAARRREASSAQADREAPRLAKIEVKMELKAKNLMLKGIHPDDRERLLMEKSEFVRKRLQEDINGQEETRRIARVEVIEALVASVVAAKAGEGQDPPF